MGRCIQPLIRRFPNGTTRLIEDQSPEMEPTRRTETSKYPEEKKINNDSPSSGERSGKSPNRSGVLLRGYRTLIRKRREAEHFGKSGDIGDSPVSGRRCGR